MNEHTQGKLFYRPADFLFGHSINDLQGNEVCELSRVVATAGELKRIDFENAEGNARRLVACWNALEDMSTEDVEAVILAGGTANEVLRGALREREKFGEAKALLWGIVNECDAWIKEVGEVHEHPHIKRIREFLKVKGGDA